MSSNPNSNPNAAASPSSRLAPGFRFHPTDEELVSYYLKRRVLGRRLAIDAISEIDLYKQEPWDLPTMSRIRTGDKEWYFFSPLDRKYSNRSRTNRATAGGYWKTTGKDRPVRNGSRTVGMKKTLVFHVGRAPRGERTNWVMHEYRLEDEDLKITGVSQDGFVVCRIFQKSGAGPQNGAQYGAPFNEQEWEEEEEDLPVQSVDRDGVGYQEYFQMHDILEDSEATIQPDNMPILLQVQDMQPSGSHLEEPPILLEDVGDQAVINRIDGHTDMPEAQDNLILHNGIEEKTFGSVQFGSPSQFDGYVELNDFVESVDVEQIAKEEIADNVSGECDNQNSPVDRNGCDYQMEFGVDEFFDILDENLHVPEPFEFPHALQDDLLFQPNDFTNSTTSEYPCVRLPEDNTAIFHASNHDVPFASDDFEHTSDLCPPVADSCGFDAVDDLMEYFDATDRTLYYDTLGPVENSDGVVLSRFNQSNSAFEAFGADPGNDASSSATQLAPNDRSNRKEEAFADKDVHGKEGSGKTLRDRLVNMLDSISSPPALAAEYPSDAVKSLAQNSATLSASSIHVTAGMIHITNLTMTNNGNHWSMQKGRDVGFLISYGMAGNDLVNKLVGSQPVGKTRGAGGFIFMVLRSGFYFLFFSTLILAASLKIGLRIYAR